MEQNETVVKGLVRCLSIKCWITDHEVPVQIMARLGSVN